MLKIRINIFFTIGLRLTAARLKLSDEACLPLPKRFTRDFMTYRLYSLMRNGDAGSEFHNLGTTTQVQVEAKRYVRVCGIPTMYR